MTLLRRQTRTAIDLHWQWTDLPGLFDWPFAEAYERRRIVKIAGAPVATLPDEERFLFLCLHGGLHFWEKLGWLCDLAWEAAESAFDHDRLRRRADQLGVARQLKLGLALAHRLLGMPLSSGGAETILPGNLLRIQERVIQYQKAVPLPKTSSGIHTLIDRLSLRDTWAQRWLELAYRGRRRLGLMR